MGKRITCLITGIMFGISLAIIGYIFLILSIALGLAKAPLAELFSISTFIFYPMALIAITGASIIFTSPKVSRVMLIIPLIFYIINVIYLLTQNIFSIGYIISTISILALGITATILSFLIKKPSKNILISNVVIQEI